MFVKVHDGKVVDTEVKELERAIAASDNKLVLVDFRPGEVVERVVCVETAKPRCVRKGALIPWYRAASEEFRFSQRTFWKAVTYAFSTWMPCAVSPRE